MGLETPGNTVCSQTIPFLDTHRQKEGRRGSVVSQHTSAKCYGGNAVDVVISVKNNPFVPIDRLEDPFNSRPHAGQEKGIRQLAEPRPEKAANCSRVLKSSAFKQPND